MECLLISVYVNAVLLCADFSVKSGKIGNEPPDSIDYEHLRANSERYLVKLLLTSMTSISYQLGKKMCKQLQVILIVRGGRCWSLKTTSTAGKLNPESFIFGFSFCTLWIYISSCHIEIPTLLRLLSWRVGLQGVSMSVAFPLTVHLLSFSHLQVSYISIVQVDSML